MLPSIWVTYATNCSSQYPSARSQAAGSMAARGSLPEPSGVHADGGGAAAGAHIAPPHQSGSTTGRGAKLSICSRTQEQLVPVCQTSFLLVTLLSHFTPNMNAYDVKTVKDKTVS